MICGILGIALYQSWNSQSEEVVVKMPLPELDSEKKEREFRLKDHKDEDAFTLDVNQADSADLTRLHGIGPVLSRRIVRYRAAIGGFRSLSDLKKVYGLKEEVYEHILPFLTISSSPSAKKRPTNSISIPSTITSIDINKASQTEFEQLKGIGPVLSQRIINYRTAIGGFEEVDQIKKVYGLAPEVFESIRPFLLLSKDSSMIDTSSIDLVAENSSVHKRVAPPPSSDSLDVEGSLSIPSPKSIPILDLNMADSVDLLALPGIGAWTASQILSYRNRIGYFVSVDQLKEIYRLTDQNFDKMLPYLTIGDLSGFEKKDLNRVKLWDLKVHRRLSDSLAEEILSARKKVGRFTSWRELMRINELDKQRIAYLRHYFFI
ncbi:MAG: helix-hairpin-helix domain-containing protein [Bacteroidota bacterium]